MKSGIIDDAVHRTLLGHLHDIENALIRDHGWTRDETGELAHRLYVAFLRGLRAMKGRREHAAHTACLKAIWGPAGIGEDRGPVLGASG